ncbi:MAG: metallophosphoesterase family protein, partial [Gemmatimonadetes bacterium]|nr:metallophosphoesterase family protein [Gemmatimonadota bacterium]
MTEGTVGRVAALYDIHGNAPALEAVLADVRAAGAELIVVGGDVIPGPMPMETIALLRDCGIPIAAIQGNGDREVLLRRAGIQSDTVPERFRDVMTWVSESLRPKDVAWLATWPATLRLDVRGLGSVLFCHATPRNDLDIFTRLTPEEV